MIWIGSSGQVVDFAWISRFISFLSNGNWKSNLGKLMRSHWNLFPKEKWTKAYFGQPVDRTGENLSCHLVASSISWLYIPATVQRAIYLALDRGASSQDRISSGDLASWCRSRRARWTLWLPNTVTARWAFCSISLADLRATLMGRVWTGICYAHCNMAKVFLYHEAVICFQGFDLGSSRPSSLVLNRILNRENPNTTPGRS